MNTNTPDHSSRAHSKRSPSGLGRYAVCPHYAPDQNRPPHPRTIEGTMIHEAVEARNPKLLPEELRQFAEAAIRYWDDILAENPGWQYRIEMPVRIPFFEDKKGHIDLVFWSPDKKRLKVLDWKAGMNSQAEAAVNVQQKCYSTGVMENFPEAEEVEVHIVYLRLEKVSIHTWYRKDFDQMCLENLAVDRRAEEASQHDIDKPGERLWHNPDPHICYDCLKSATCPALHQLALPVAQAYASARPEDLVIPDAYDPALITDPSVMGRAYVLAGVMEKWCESVKFYATQMRLEQGIEIPGTQLAHRAGKKSISDPNEALRIAEQFGISHDEFMTAVEVSGPKLLKIAHDKAPKGKKKVAEENLENALQDAGVMSIGSETLYLRKSK